MKFKTVFWIFAFLLSQGQCHQRISAKTEEFLEGYFPQNFKWGFATSAYQIEGGYSSEGKGESIWDEFTHRDPSPVIDSSTGDVACNSYQKYPEDVQLLKNLGAKVYRFSLSWSRILPTGTLEGGINQAGINYYNRLIDELLANGIEPLVTLYHWDLPQPLQADFGGWVNEELAQFFGDYSRVAFEAFGDRVKTWITINEPWVICRNGYGHGNNAPGISEPATEPYKCGHTLLKSHAESYHIYNNEFKPTQNGRIGITLDSGWYEPANSSNPQDVEAAERALQFKHGWFAWPIFYGQYPQVMRTLIDDKSEAEGRNESRLPIIDSEFSEKIKGTWDYIGLNHYTTELVEPSSGGNPGWDGDQNTKVFSDPSWPAAASNWLKMVPFGFRKLLNWIKNTYGDPEILVTENGFSDINSVGIYDMGRAQYYKYYLNEMLKAINIDGVNVTAYTAWSALDNFEWDMGYSIRFGVHTVDFNNPERPREPKYSASVLKKIYLDNGFPPKMK